MKGKYFRFFLVDVMHFIALLACWLVVWGVSGLNLVSWKGLALFVAVVIIAMLGTIRNLIYEIIEDKYKK